MRFNPLRNIVLKVSAVALALLLWVHVATNKTYDYQLNLPLKVTSVPKGLVLLSDVPRIAAVKVKATGKQLILLTNTNPELKISAADGRPGTVEKTIGSADLAEALGRSIESAEVLIPRSLNLKFDKEVEKRLPVRSAIKAEAAIGFAVAAPPRIEPESVVVSGPASLLHQLKFLETTNQSLTGLIAATSQRIGLALPESLHLSVSDSTVMVKVEVERAQQRTFSNLSITPPPGFPAADYEMVPSRLTVVLNVPESRMSALSTANISVSFRRPQLLSDTTRAPIECVLPAGATFARAGMDSVTLIRKK